MSSNLHVGDDRGAVLFAGEAQRPQLRDHRLGDLVELRVGALIGAVVLDGGPHLLVAQEHGGVGDLELGAGAGQERARRRGRTARDRGRRQPGNRSRRGSSRRPEAASGWWGRRRRAAHGSMVPGRRGGDNGGARWLRRASPHPRRPLPAPQPSSRCCATILSVLRNHPLGAAQPSSRCCATILSVLRDHPLGAARPSSRCCATILSVLRNHPLGAARPSSRCCATILSVLRDHPLGAARPSSRCSCTVLYPLHHPRVGAHPPHRERAPVPSRVLIQPFVMRRHQPAGPRLVEGLERSATSAGQPGTQTKRSVPPSVAKNEQV